MDEAMRSDGVRQYLTFRAAGEEYAIGILQVREIIEFTASTRVPGTPEWIHGVINLRGRVVPVVDLSVRFGMGITQVTQWTCAVIVEVAADDAPIVMGILADSVSEVLEIDGGSIEPAPAFGTVARADYLLGVARTAGGLVLVLDVDAVLPATAAAALPAAAAVAGAADAAAAG
jgi:purine-binding chemotaxis protein CheW